LVITYLILASCNEKQLNETPPGCYFQYEYVNYAWGYQHSGFTVTPVGEVYKFDASTPWVFADNERLSLSDLKKNIEASVKVDTIINAVEIDRYQQLAVFAMSGKISDPISRGADLGEFICKIVVPDTSDPHNGYREVILTENGDFDRHNLSPEAAVIAEWLSRYRIH
jgi:hypothetical protein